MRQAGASDPFPGTPGHDLLAEAIALAARAHSGQVDRLGAPYILHPLRVMLRLEDPLVQVAAVLHDVVEDTSLSLENLAEAGFPEQVIEAVDAMTRRPGEEYFAYVARAGRHPHARRIKIADLMDNIERTLLLPPTQDNLMRLARYREALARLMAEAPSQSSPDSDRMSDADPSR